MKVKKLTSSYIRSLIKPRRKNDHKGSYGHVLVLAGSKSMTGAQVLCSTGALRAGTGLVTASVLKSQYQIIAKHLRPEAMMLILDETRKGTISGSSITKIINFINNRKITSLVLGPGLGVSKDVYKIVKKILSAVDLPLVLDADGINVLSGESKNKKFEINSLKSAKSKITITPHPGELARLLNISTKEINKNRVDTARRLANANKLVCVLKGHKTVVTDGNKAFVNSTGNPGMATGGSGDVLAGMISSFTSQVKEPVLLNASLVGVYIHGLAGDIAAKRKTKISMLAGDMVELISNAVRKVKNG